jgi:hypothetical protein
MLMFIRILGRYSLWMWTMLQTFQGFVMPPSSWPKFAYHLQLTLSSRHVSKYPPNTTFVRRCVHWDAAGKLCLWIFWDVTEWTPISAVNSINSFFRRVVIYFPRGTNWICIYYVEEIQLWKFNLHGIKVFRGNFNDVTEMEISLWVNNIKIWILTLCLELPLHKKKFKTS